MSPPRKPLFEPEEVTAPVAAATPSDAVDEDELDEVPGAAPEADVVASRALMVGVMLERARLEEQGDVAPLAKLRALVEAHGLLGNLGPGGLALFEAEAGAWSTEDREAVRWTAEELHLLLWALGHALPPPLDARAAPAELLAKLPLAGDVAAFLDGAALKPLEALEAQRALWDVVQQAVETEITARSALEDPAQLEGDPQVDDFLAAAKAGGFVAPPTALDRAAEFIAALRFEVRALLEDLFAEGSPHRAQRLEGARLAAMSEAELATFYGLAHTRAGACAWLVEGDHFEDDDADDAP